MSLRALALNVLLPIAAGVALGGAAGLIPTPWTPGERIAAVLLVDGQAYFGHVLDLPWSDTVQLSDVYYFQDARTSSTNLPLALLKRGSELHQPTDGMTFRRDKVLAIEMLRADSSVRAAETADRALPLVPRPEASAERPAVDAQVVAAEHGIQRGYAASIDQLNKVKELKLAIGADQAASLDRKARDDLRAVRHDAIAAVAGLLALKGTPADSYVASVERELDQGTYANEPGVLLAPPLYEIVRRADDIFQQTSDNAIRQLTGTAGPSPSPTPHR